MPESPAPAPKPRTVDTPIKSGNSAQDRYNAFKNAHPNLPPGVYDLYRAVIEELYHTTVTP